GLRNSPASMTGLQAWIQELREAGRDFSRGPHRQERQAGPLRRTISKRVQVSRSQRGGNAQRQKTGPKRVAPLLLPAHTVQTWFTTRSNRARRRLSAASMAPSSVHLGHTKCSSAL